MKPAAELCMPSLKWNEMSLSGFHKTYLSKRGGNNNSSSWCKIALRFRGLGCGGRFFFSFQVGRKAQMLGALGTKLTKHYIATWPSVGIKWWLFSMMLHWYFPHHNLWFALQALYKGAFFPVYYRWKLAEICVLLAKYPLNLFAHRGWQIYFIYCWILIEAATIFLLSFMSSKPTKLFFSWIRLCSQAANSLRCSLTFPLSLSTCHMLMWLCLCCCCSFSGHSRYSGNLTCIRMTLQFV